MRHREFLIALQAQVLAYTLLHKAIKRRCRPEFVRMILTDAFSQAANEQFGTPLVNWFSCDGAIKAAAVENGTVIFDPGAAFEGGIFFLESFRALKPFELPENWRETALVVGRFQRNSYFSIDQWLLQQPRRKTSA